MGKRENLKGRVFNNWTVISDPIYKDGRTYYECECSCSKKTRKIVRSDQLKNNSSRGCGCYKIKHGKAYDRIYRIWYGMNRRCSVESESCYYRYGELGISVCDEWSWNNKNGLDNFYKWALENGYEDSLTIERKNVYGNYEESNCCWITMFEQANNKRDTIKIEIDGKTKTLCDIARESGIGRETILKRYKSGYRGKDLLVDGIINNTSGVVGVSYSNSQNNWRAYINVGGNRIELGRRKNKEDAIKLRKEAEEKYFKEYNRNEEDLDNVHHT